MQELDTEGGSDRPDGARLELEAAAAKDATLPRHHPGHAFQPLPPADTSSAPSDLVSSNAPLPDPNSDRLLRRRLPTLSFAAGGGDFGSRRAEAAPAVATQLLHAAAVDHAWRAAMLGPGSYDPPLWLQVCDLSHSG